MSCGLRGDSSGGGMRVGAFSFGGVIRLTFRVVGLRPVGFLCAALVLQEAPLRLGPLLLAPAAAALGGGGWGHAVLRWLAAAAPVLVAQCGLVLLDGAVARAALDAAEGRPARLGGSLRAGLAALPANAAVFVLFWLGALAGLALLVVPGLMLISAWAVAVPAQVAERAGARAALRRSAALTRGRRWPVLAIVLLLLAVQFLGGALEGDVAAVLPGDPWAAAGAQAIDALIGAVLAVVATANGAAMYLALRRAEAGALPAELAEAFG